MNCFRTPLIAFFLALSFLASGQIPLLEVKGTKDKNSKVVLQRLSINVEIFGNIARTKTTMTFYNPNHRILEGELTFPLPEGASVDSYALDINGKLRLAVPVEKAKATEVFESIERRNIDPGLLEKVDGNSFRTRIYPIPTQGYRTVTVGYNQELSFAVGKSFRYHLPMVYQQVIPELSLKVIVFDGLVKPDLVEQPDGSFSLRNHSSAYVGEMKKTNYQSQKSLTINLPKRNDIPEVQMQQSDQGNYFLVNVFPKAKSRSRKISDTIGIVWDCSLSGLKRDLNKELSLLGHLITKKKDLVVKLALLNNSFNLSEKFIITKGNWKLLREKLENIIYDGGTNFSQISSKGFSAGEYLFFTDGFSSFGEANVRLQAPIFAIASAPIDDFDVLKLITNRTGGQLINLNNTNDEDAIRQLTEQPLRYLGIKNKLDVRETFPSYPRNVNGHLAVAGILSRYSTAITLQFGYGNKVVEEINVRLANTEQPLSEIAVDKVWAQKKIEELTVNYYERKQEITYLGKRFGIVTKNTSLIVLENLEDYLRYKINPPEELRVSYKKAMKQHKHQVAEERENIMAQAISKSAELKEWWNRDFTKKHAEKQIEQLHDNREPPAAHDMMRMPPPVSETVSAYNNSPSFKNDKFVDEKAQEPSISVMDFKSDKEYMKMLKGKPDEAYQHYLKIRPKYINTPTFYFDVANWFYQQKDEVRAVTILSGIADLELENADIYKLMAYKLKETGDYVDALFLCKKVLEWRPMESQSYRDYALALAETGNYQQALDYLYKVLNQSYTLETVNRDEGIEEIIIAEINNLIDIHGDKLNTKFMDKRLIQSLPVDIRVVLSWNRNDTDIDLWLTDPNGEKCYYEHMSTAIGGRLSNDFTAGYGPEQFLLKKAVRGRYKIEVNYYGDRQVSIVRPTTVTTEIFTKYASGSQKRKIIVLPMEGKKDEGSLIGTFVF